jgi:uncharacterized protein (TIGR02145 family)
MKSKCLIYFLGVVIFLLSQFTSCKKDTILTLPILSTSEISEITETSAKAGGSITASGGANIIERGVCWDTSPDPTTDNSRLVSGKGIGSFEATITNLSPNLKYYLRAYAINSVGISYGDQVTFVTKTALAVLTTSEVSSITSSGARSGGNITYNGGAGIISQGVCFSTTPGPTIQNKTVSSETGPAAFEVELKELTYFTTYYIRAYATNQAGTAYGNEFSFTTLPTTATLGAVGINIIGTETATASVIVLNDGGASVSSRGFCWSTSSNPTIQDNSSSVNSGIGAFDFNINGLNFGTVYHVRAYATNSLGTAYSNDFDFCTDLKDIDGNVYDVLKFGTQYWMQSNLKTKHFSNGDIIPIGTGSILDWSTLSTPAYSWYVWGYSEDAFKAIYGLYYNWNAVADSRNICPAGWHVPTDNEWTILADNLGGADVAGGKMKTTGTVANGDGLWEGSNTGATNSSNFSALPSGGRTNSGFLTIGTSGYWWTSTEASTQLVWIRFVYKDFPMLGRNSEQGTKSFGYAVRCLKN